MGGEKNPQRRAQDYIREGHVLAVPGVGMQINEAKEAAERGNALLGASPLAQRPIVAELQREFNERLDEINMHMRESRRGGDGRKPLAPLAVDGVPGMKFQEAMAAWMESDPSLAASAGREYSQMAEKLLGKNPNGIGSLYYSQLYSDHIGPDAMRLKYVLGGAGESAPESFEWPPEGRKIGAATKKGIRNILNLNVKGAKVAFAKISDTEIEVSFRSKSGTPFLVHFEYDEEAMKVNATGSLEREYTAEKSGNSVRVTEMRRLWKTDCSGENKRQDGQLIATEGVSGVEFSPDKTAKPQYLQYYYATHVDRKPFSKKNLLASRLPALDRSKIYKVFHKPSGGETEGGERVTGHIGTLEYFNIPKYVSTVKGGTEAARTHIVKMLSFPASPKITYEGNAMVATWQEKGEKRYARAYVDDLNSLIDITGDLGSRSFRYEKAGSNSLAIYGAGWFVVNNTTANSNFEQRASLDSTEMIVFAESEYCKGKGKYYVTETGLEYARQEKPKKVETSELLQRFRPPEFALLQGR